MMTNYNDKLGSDELFEAAKEGNPKKHFLSPKCVYKTLSLFVEKNTTKEKAIFTLKPFDWKGYTSFKRIYLECCDPVGYVFAEKHLYDYEHLMKLKNNKVLIPFFDKWDLELDLKMRSQAIQSIRGLSQEAGTTALSAAKFLAEKKYEYKGKGRPKKEDVARRVAEDARLTQQLDEDYNLLQQ